MVKNKLLALVLCAAGCMSPNGIGSLVPPTAEQDPNLPQISLNVGGHPRQVHLETFGDESKPVLLFLHGSLGDFRAFLPFQVLSDKYFVVMWDQRGSGLSERIEKHEYTEQSVVDEIDTIKQRYSPERPVTLIGHSFGATYASLYMSRHPDNVAQAVLIEPAGLTGDIFSDSLDDIVNIDLFGKSLNQLLWQTETLSAWDHAQMDYKALQLLLDGSFSNYFCDPENPPPLSVWRPGAYVETIRLQMLSSQGNSDFDFDFRVGLDEFEPEVLFIAGECSALGYVFQERYHLPLFKNATMVRIEDAGHRLFVEKFDDTLSAIRGYLLPE